MAVLTGNDTILYSYEEHYRRDRGIPWDEEIAFPKYLGWISREVRRFKAEARIPSKPVAMTGRQIDRFRAWMDGRYLQGEVQ